MTRAQTVEAARVAALGAVEMVEHAAAEPAHDACHLCLGVGRCPDCGGDGMRDEGSAHQFRRAAKRRELTRLRDSLVAALEQVDLELEGI